MTREDMEIIRLEKSEALSADRAIVEREELAAKWDHFMDLANQHPKDSMTFSYYIGVADALRCILDVFRHARDL